MGIWKSVEVDVDIEVEDVIDFIDSASDRELKEIKDAIKEYEMDSNPIHSYLYNTQRYDDLMDAVNNAVNRHVDLRIMTDIINSLK